MKKLHIPIPTKLPENFHNYQLVNTVGNDPIYRVSRLQTQADLGLFSHHRK